MNILQIFSLSLSLFFLALSLFISFGFSHTEVVSFHEQNLPAFSVMALNFLVLIKKVFQRQNYEKLGYILYYGCNFIIFPSKFKPVGIYFHMKNEGRPQLYPFFKKLTVAN